MALWMVHAHPADIRIVYIHMMPNAPKEGMVQESILTVTRSIYTVGYCNSCFDFTYRSKLSGSPAKNGQCCVIVSKGTCSVCGGDGKVNKPINCKHSKSSSHQYCSHDKTTQHDD